VYPTIIICCGGKGRLYSAVVLGGGGLTSRKEKHRERVQTTGGKVLFVGRGGDLKGGHGSGGLTFGGKKKNREKGFVRGKRKAKGESSRKESPEKKLVS